MENSQAAADLLWQQKQDADRLARDLERREWLKSFVLVLLLLVLTIVVATFFANRVITGASTAM